MNPDQVIVIQGAGAIPNSSFQVTTTTAHLAVTVPTSPLYVLNRCVLNIVTGDFQCYPGTPKSFNLPWVNNGVGTVSETTKRVETLGPVTTKYKGGFTSLTANVNGTWDGHSPANLAGTLRDTQSTTIIREITVEPNP
jgi:hypothetical protein